MITLMVKQKGHLLNIPGIAPFRTPAKVDITNTKLHLVVSALHNAGIDYYEIIAKKDKKEIVYTKEDFEPKKEKKTDNSAKINARFNRIENLLFQLVQKKPSRKGISEEQITNKLKTLEELSQRILEKEIVREIVYTSSQKGGEIPLIEELDENTFIPSIDISDMELKGTTSKTVGTIDDVDEVAKALSQLKRTGD